jgi:hypothetical protein
VEGRRLYLRLGDRVEHRDHEEWGEGAVVEEMTSMLEGGTCLVRVLFADGRQRTFHNDLDNELCCYFFGVRKQWRVGGLLETGEPRRSRSRRRSQALNDAATGSPGPLAPPRLGERSAPRIGARDVQTGERPLRVDVDPGTPSAHGCGMPCSSAFS